MKHSAPTDPTLKILVGVVLGVVALAIVVVAIRPGQAELDPDSPEGVVQRYIEAWLEGSEAAHLLVDGDECTERFPPPNDVTLRVVLESSEIAGDEAEVRVVITETYGEPLDQSQYTSTETFTLERTEEGWRIDRLPPRFEICPERNRP